MFANPFVYPVERYKRDHDFIKAAIHNAALYISKSTGYDLSYCIEWVTKKISKGGTFALKDPEVLALVKDKPACRKVTTMPLSHYLLDIKQNNRIAAPTLTTYIHPTEKMSLLADYMRGNIKKRSVSKKAMFVAEQEGNHALKNYRDKEQSVFKIKNNSMSGAHASPYTPLYNKSAHSTLTSICRCASGYGNANNEKFITGNRHYWHPRITLNNIISIISKTDLEVFETMMKRYGIISPSVEQTMECITYSTDLYWKSPFDLEIIRNLVERLTPVERAAFCYTGDLYHLAQVNPDMVYKFLDTMSERAVDNPLSLEETDRLLNETHSSKQSYIFLLCPDLMRGKPLKEVRTDPVAYGLLGATIKRTNEVLEDYREFIEVCLRTDNIPASVYYIPNSIRRSAVLSDTDSTIFTVQYWTKWFCKEESFSTKSRAVANTMVFMTSEMITHWLAILSANIGAVGDDIHLLKMKPEYSFPVLSLTSRAKHYYAYIDAREGNVYSKLDTEIKGVALRSSNSPKHIISAAHDMIKYGMDCVMKGEKIDVDYVLSTVAGVERDIIDSVMKGDPRYMKTGQIKPPESYVAGEDASTYRHYLMWQEVFAPKYGESEPPTYRYVKVPIRCGNKTELAAWIESLEDKGLAARLRDWFTKEEKVAMKSLYLPESIVAANEIPAEIIKAVDVRQLVAQTMEPFYLVLESYNLFFVDDKRTKLVSDFYKPATAITA